jgi:hypothetical protein
MQEGMEAIEAGVANEVAADIAARRAKNGR